METRKEPAQAPRDPAGWPEPLAAWEAMSRWNRFAFEYVASSWQQWLALVTTVPPQFLAPPEVAPTPVPKRPATQKKSAAQGRKRG